MITIICVILWTYVKFRNWSKHKELLVLIVLQSGTPMRDVELTTEWGHGPQSRSCGASNHAVHEFGKEVFGWLWVTIWNCWVECYGKSLFHAMGWKSHFLLMVMLANARGYTLYEDIHIRVLSEFGNFNCITTWITCKRCRDESCKKIIIYSLIVRSISRTSLRDTNFFVEVGNVKYNIMGTTWHCTLFVALCPLFSSRIYLLGCCGHLMVNL